MKMKCLIADDEYPALVLLEDYISKTPELELVAKCENAMEANQYIKEGEIDLMFLDIQMPDLTGLELLKSLKHKPLVILTTAYSEYALESYELDVTDYLVKPFSFERFVQSVNKAKELIHLKRAGKQQSGSAQKPHFFVKADYKKVRVNLEDIRYIEGLREYVSIYTRDKRIITLEAMKNLEASLPNDQFIRIHKSYIIAIDKVTALVGNMVELGDKQIPIGKMYREKVKQVFV